MEEVQATSTPDRTLAHVARLHLDALAAKGRSRSHLETVESHIRVHLLPQFGTRPIDRLDEDDLTRFIARRRRDGKAPKTIKNVLSHFTRSSTSRSGADGSRSTPAGPLTSRRSQRRRTSASSGRRNSKPCYAKASIPSDPCGLMERPLYLIAAMTGMRQGELLGLRWRDLDWLAQKVRVRQAWVRGEFKAPKSCRGVPMADLLAGDLERLFQASAFVGDDDLVFANPSTGGPLRRSTVRKRFQRACRQAGVRIVRFHDLRHTFGTRMAATGEVSMRRLQEWMGHRDLKTTLVYADYQPDEREAEMVERAFAGERPPISPRRDLTTTRSSGPHGDRT
jgi:integrase